MEDEKNNLNHNKEPMELDNSGDGRGDEAQPEDLMTRVRQYLNKRKTTVVDTVISLKDRLFSKNVASTYSAIQKNNEKALCAPNLHGMESPILCKTGSFFNGGDMRMAGAYFRSNYAKSLNVSLSFEPSSFLCQKCGAGPHPVVSGGGGGSGLPTGRLRHGKWIPPGFGKFLS